MLGVLYAALGAFTFALNNVAMRRGVVTGSVLQGMALTVPIGGLSFLVMTIAFGELHQLVVFPMAAVAWLACQGVVHFVHRPLLQLQVQPADGREPDRPGRPAAGALRHDVGGGDAAREIHCAAGDRLGFDAGRLIHHPGQCRQGKRRIGAGGGDAVPTVRSQAEPAAPEPKPTFQPRVFSGYLFGLGAAMCYGSSPLMAREAFLHAPGVSTAAGGCVAYAAATLFFLLILLKPGSWADIRSMKRENLPWFLASAVLVAISQAFVYASLAVAPLMVVTPILQLSLVFRLFLSQLINREHEVMNTAVIIGAFTAVLGSILVALDTDELTTLLQLPSWFADFLHYRLAGQ